MRFLFSLLFIVLVNALSAQSKRILHQTFSVENYNQINLNFYEESFEVVQWVGNTVLTETNVALENGMKHLLNFHVDSLSRYEIVEVVEGQTISLESFDMNRAVIAIKYNGSELYPNELVDLVVYIPDTFVEESPNVFVRKEEN
jgi:hypothetical protein